MMRVRRVLAIDSALVDLEPFWTLLVACSDGALQVFLEDSLLDSAFGHTSLQEVPHVP
jgi:hypothetical protein